MRAQHIRVISLAFGSCVQILMLLCYLNKRRVSQSQLAQAHTRFMALPQFFLREIIYINVQMKMMTVFVCLYGIFYYSLPPSFPLSLSLQLSVSIFLPSYIITIQTFSMSLAQFAKSKPSYFLYVFVYLRTCVSVCRSYVFKAFSFKFNIWALLQLLSCSYSCSVFEPYERAQYYCQDNISYTWNKICQCCEFSFFFLFFLLLLPRSFLFFLLFTSILPSVVAVCVSVTLARAPSFSFILTISPSRSFLFACSLLALIFRFVSTRKRTHY